MSRAPCVSEDWATAYPRRSGDWTVRGRDGRWGVLDPESGTIEMVDPASDPALPALADAMGRGRLIGYRAGRRAVVSTAHAFVKVVRPRRLPTLLRAHETLAKVATGVDIPDVLAVDRRGAVDLAPVGGTSLHDVLRSGTKQVVLESVRLVGAALAGVHDTSVEGIVVQAAVPARAWIETIRRAEPDPDDLVALAARLPSVRPGTTAIVHGDLHDKNVLVSEEGIGVIDLDGVGIGAPEDDIANLAVHLQLRVLQQGADPSLGQRYAEALYDAYNCETPLDPTRLLAVERHTWFRLACLYRYRRRSRHLVPEMVRRAAGRP